MSEVQRVDRLTESDSPKKRRKATVGRKAKASDIKTSAKTVDKPSSNRETGLKMCRLLALYRSEVIPTMMREFSYSNPMQVPHLRKVVLNIGLGEALTNSRAVEYASNDLSVITGQKPIMTKAKKSIAAFKLREGVIIGTCVTLRGARMYHFVDRLLNAALPRIRDFRGLSRTSFDGRGGYSMGIKEQIIFPEIEYGQIDRIRGMQVTFNTNARTNAEAARLLELLGMPLVRQGSSE